jgi:hypothetical protein
VSARGHLRLFGLATLVWLAFLVAGLPGYYRQYSTRSLVVFEVVLLAPVVAFAVAALRPARRLTRMRRAIAIAFWFTVPLFFYDLAYCGLWLGHGLRFVVTYWWLTAYYAVPWVVLPATAWWLDRREAIDSSE